MGGNMKRLAMLAVVVGLVGPAWAADWVEIAQSVSGSVCYIDKASVTVKALPALYPERYGTFYWKRVIVKGDPKIAISMLLSAVDCKEKKIYSGYSVANYDAENKLLFSGSRIPKGDEIVPETMGEADYRYICGVH